MYSTFFKSSQLLMWNKTHQIMKFVIFIMFEFIVNV